MPVEFPEDLPISSRVRDIASAIADHQVVIVAGETGSGKTTQLPKICLAMGRGTHARIGVTQPRRIAATSVATRVAKELDVELGREVGYQIRFSDKTSPATYVKFMTDGILLAEIQGDPLLTAYDTIVLDEAHERSLNIDLLLGYFARLLPKRPDLRVIVSSATLEHDRFSAFFGDAPVIQVSGRTYPVEVIYRPRDGETDLAQTIAETVEEITSIDPREDILIFLPGEREIHEAMDALTDHALPHTVLLPLYGRLAQADQGRVFQPLPQRRVVLATNVAETSLTIPGIVYVIDTGLARVNRLNPRTGVTQLLVEPISRASADQRKGRAGRTRSGVCFRLYEEQDFASRPAYTDPEIARVGLAGAILQTKSLGLGALEELRLLDPPAKRSVDEGYRTLEEIGALDAQRQLTDEGKKLSRLPLDPRIGRMILAGDKEGALSEVLVLAAALGVQDPRERPMAHKDQADLAHKKFRDETSDFLGWLKLWSFFEETRKQSRRQLEQTCRKNFLSYVRMRQWADVHKQLSSVARDLGFRAKEGRASDEAVHRAILPGLLSRVATWHPDSRQYMGARQTRFKLHPSSGLARKPPAWIVAAELVETSQLFARTVARIDPAWLEELGAALCKRSYGDPGYSEKQAQVSAKESVSLFGLPIAQGRKVHYGPIDPVLSRRIFLLHALVRGEYSPRERPVFMKHNRALFDRADELRARARRSDMIADEDALLLFFEPRVPDGVYSGKTFEEWRIKAEASDPRVLHLSLDDVLLGDAREVSTERYPDTLAVSGTRLGLTYRFDPGEDDDGITLTVPLPALLGLDPGVLEWTIPGYLRDKIALLLHSLPKSAKKGLPPVPELAATLADSLTPFEEPMLPALGQALFELSGTRVPAEAWNLHDLPPYLRFWFRVVDGDRTLGTSRELGELRERFGPRAREAWSAAAGASWERDGLTTWSFDELPEEATLQVGGVRVAVYPALVDHETSVSLRGQASREAAVTATRAGLRRLFLLALGGGMNRLEQQVPAGVAASSLAEGAEVPPRRQIVMRAIDECFGLDDPARFPRKRAAFHERFETGRRDLPRVLAELGALAQEIGRHLDQTRADLRALAGKPGAPRASLEDVRSQIAHLAPPGLLRHATRERLAHLPRYLRAIRVRLERMPNGPQKDQAKAALVLPFWNDWLQHHEKLRSRGVAPHELEAFRWLIEEYRVAVFAPEVRAAVPVSPQRLTEQWKALLG